MTFGSIITKNILVEIINCACREDSAVSRQKLAVGFNVKGIDVQCPICHGTLFWEGRAQLNTAGMAFFNLEFLNKEIQILTCDHCNHVLWFDDTRD
jgi:uncharacterized protein YbaR (Trm112 family)